MKIIDNYSYDGLMPLKNLTKLAPKDDILYFDIETTGLSRKNNHIYLIGCGHYTNSGLNIIQWFAENEQDEINVLKAFLDYSSSFEYLVNYNGKSFDIPFTTERLQKYGMTMPEFTSIDIYTLVKPLKKILSLNDLTQKSVEAFLDIKREDKYNGGELIHVYKDYVSLSTLLNSSENSMSIYEKRYVNNKIDQKYELLLLHNREDVLNMHEIVKILDYTQISESNPIYSSYEIKEYTDYNGNTKKELIVLGLHNCESLPKCFNTFQNDGSYSYLMNFSCDKTLQIRIPVADTTLNYYIDNYKDYYYLPNEDICILKSMAGGVLKENRENAKKETCRVRLTDYFLPLPASYNINGIRRFRNEYKSKLNYIRLADFESMEDALKTEYLNAIFKYMF